MRKTIIGLLLVSLGSLPAVHAGKPPKSGGGDTGTSGVVAQNLGVLPGDKYSDAWDVNTRGHAVGRSYNSGNRTTPQLTKAFYWNGTMQQLLPATQAPSGEGPWESEAWAIGDALPTAVGLEHRTVCTPDPDDPTSKVCDYDQYPIIWQNAGATPAAVRLGIGPGRAFGINDSATAAVGVSGGGVGAIWWAPAWGAAATNIFVPPEVNAADAYVQFPDGHTQASGNLRYEGTAFDVNDSGIVVGTLTTIDKIAEAKCLATEARPCVPDVSFSRSYVYLSGPGIFKVLPTPTGSRETSAYAVSNITDTGKVYVAGWTGWRTSDRTTEINKGMRWTVDAATGDSVVEEVLTGQAWAEGVTQDGFVAGTHNSSPSRRGNIVQTATLWNPAVGYIPLKPSGGSDSASRAMAGRCLGTAIGPIYVVGVANVSGAWTAARWEIQCSTASP